MTVPKESAGYDAYAEFRTALSGLDPDTALIARHFAATSLDELAKETDQRVQAALAAAVYDANTMTPENREFMVSMILADVTA